MNKPPAFQFYADDFLGGTCDMTAEEVGCYIRLLCYQWNTGAAPLQADRMRTIAGANVSDHVIGKFPICEDGKRRNQRLEFERQKQTEYRAKQSEKGRKSAAARSTTVQPRFNHGSNPVDVRLQPEGNSPSPSPSPIIIHTHTAEIPTWEEVKTAAEMTGVTAESAKGFFDHHQGNQLWINQHGKMIDWRHKLKSWAEKDRQKPKPSATGTSTGESVFAIKTKLEEVRKAKQRAKDKAAPDPLGGLQFSNEADKAEFKRLAALEKELAQKLTKA